MILGICFKQHSVLSKPGSAHSQTYLQCLCCGLPFIHPLNYRFQRIEGQTKERWQLKPPSQPSVTDYFNKTGHCFVYTPGCVWGWGYGTHSDFLASLILVLPILRHLLLQVLESLGWNGGGNEFEVEERCQGSKPWLLMGLGRVTPLSV